MLGGTRACEGPVKAIVNIRGAVPEPPAGRLTLPGCTRQRRAMPLRDRYRSQPLHVPRLDPVVAARHELADTVQRARLGGLFYVAGWITLGLTAQAHVEHPVFFFAGLLLFLLLALLRLRRPPASANGGNPRWILNLWLVVWLSTGLSGLGASWVLATSPIEAARVLALVLVGAFGTTLSHVYAMRPWFALLGLSMVFLPQVGVLLLRLGDRLLGISFLIYYIYLVLVLRRAHAEYWQRVALEEEIREQRDFYEQQSRRDGLTGLPNRRRFDAALAAALAERASSLSAEAVSLILFDLDHFKSVNDRHGHAIGDRCLVHFARCLTEAFDGRHELPARLGGEEFAVILPRCGLAEATTRAEWLRKAVAGLAIEHEHGRVPLTVSGGVVCAETAESPDSLLARADTALYDAKRLGRDRIVTGHARHDPTPPKAPADAPPS